MAIGCDVGGAHGSSHEVPMGAAVGYTAFKNAMEGGAYMLGVLYPKPSLYQGPKLRIS